MNETYLQDLKLFETAFLYAPIGMALVSLEGYFLKVNPALCKMLEYSEEELKNKTFHSLTYIDDLENNLAYTQKALDGDIESYQLEKRYTTKSGKTIWTILSAVIVRNELGNPQFFISQLIDITARKKAESLLQESEQRHKSLVKYTPVGIFAMDLTGKFFEVSPSYVEITGYSAEELLSMTFRDVVHPEMLAWGEQNYGKALKGELPHVELTLKHKNGTQIDVIASSSPIIINGETVGIYVITKDITQQKRTEELLLKAEKLSIVGELAAGIAHEIRNPLTSLRGFVQLFQKEDATGARKIYHDVMLSEIDRINEIISEFLVLAKPTNETIHLSDISKKIEHVITLFEGEAHLYNIEIKKDFDEYLPLIHTQGTLKQVFINILKNAMESMSDGGEILIQARQMDDSVCIRFIDHGCGIPADQLSKIGIPFFTTKETGTGLGLMVSQRIVQNHKGTMQVKSEVGKGTTVEVILPIG